MPEKFRNTQDESIDENKRRFFKQVGAAGAAMLIPNITHAAGDYEETSDEEFILEFSNSAWFEAEVDQHVELVARDLEFIKAYGGKVTVGDSEQRTRLEYIADELQVEGLTDEGLEAMRQAAVGLVIQESRCDADRVSEVGAAGIWMIMPDTWAELADEGMNIKSLVDATIVAGRLFSQANKYLEHTCSEALEQIKNNMYAGDQVLFEKEFLVFVLLSSYHTGMGTLSKIIQAFAEEFPTPEDTIGALSENTAVLNGKDVFLLMVNTAYTRGDVSGFGDHSVDYVFKSQAANKMLETELPPDEYFTLLGVNPGIPQSKSI